MKKLSKGGDVQLSSGAPILALSHSLRHRLLSQSRTMLLLPILIATLTVSSALAAPTASRCAELWELAPKHLADLQVYVAQQYPGERSATSLRRVKLICII